MKPDNKKINNFCKHIKETIKSELQWCDDLRPAKRCFKEMVTINLEKYFVVVKLDYAVRKRATL